MLRLHYAPGTISIAAAIGLEEAGVDYEPVRVDFGSGAQRGADYLALNPKGRVPAIEIPGGVLTETGAILEYAAPKLVPGDPLKAARMREVMFYLASTMHVAHAHKMRGERWANDDSSIADMKRKVPETVALSCRYLEGALALTPFAVGEMMSCADPYLFVVLGWVPGDGVDLGDYPRLAEYYEMMATRPSVQAIRERGMT